MRHTAPGESALTSSWLPELLGWGRHKTQAQPSLRLCGVPENLNLSSLGLGSACNSEHMRREWVKPRVAGTLRVLPTHASDICLQCPSLPAAQLNKRTLTRDHLRPPVSGWKLDTKETSKQKPNKHREPLQKGPVRQIKIPVGNTNYTRRGL